MKKIDNHNETIFSDENDFILLISESMKNAIEDFSM